MVFFFAGCEGDYTNSNYKKSINSLFHFLPVFLRILSEFSLIIFDDETINSFLFQQCDLNQPIALNPCINMLTITNATITDIPLIREITYRVWPSTYIPIIGREQLDYMLDLFYTPDELKKQMEVSGHNFILCYSDETPVGFASYSELEPGIYKLHKLYVLPETQGMGAGRMMLQHLAKAIKQAGGNLLRLNVNRYNTNAMAFYSKYGFRHSSDEDIDIGGGYFMNDYVLEIDA